jgi:cysteinyl-tRNA synthetase
VERALDLERTIHDWSRDTTQTDDVDHARAALRSMIVRLGEAAVTGSRDLREDVAPLVEALLDLRRAAREARDFATSDAVRDRLAAAGIEVRDTPAGPEWEIRGR